MIKIKLSLELELALAFEWGSFAIKPLMLQMH